MKASNMNGCYDKQLPANALLESVGDVMDQIMSMVISGMRQMMRYANNR